MPVFWFVNINVVLNCPSLLVTSEILLVLVIDQCSIRKVLTLGNLSDKVETTRKKENSFKKIRGY